MLIQITYTITNTVNGSFTCHISVSQPSGSTLDKFMEEAQKMDKHFRFTFEEDPTFGKFITSINGLANDKAQNLYWMFYKDEKLLDRGVSSFQPQSEDHIFAKYEKARSCK
ncbi:cobalamin binding intrinsic factor-like [Cetorhinus maximus]